MRKKWMLSSSEKLQEKREFMTNHHPFAILVHDQPHPLDSLKPVLRDLSVETCSVRTCEEAGRLITQTEPQLVFTDTSLPDGSWADVVRMAERASSRVDVIVVWSQGRYQALPLSFRGRRL